MMGQQVPSHPTRGLSIFNYSVRSTLFLSQVPPPAESSTPKCSFNIAWVVAHWEDCLHLAHLPPRPSDMSMSALLPEVQEGRSCVLSQGCDQQLGVSHHPLVPPWRWTPWASSTFIVMALGNGWLLLTLKFSCLFNVLLVKGDLLLSKIMTCMSLQIIFQHLFVGGRVFVFVGVK